MREKEREVHIHIQKQIICTYININKYIYHIATCSSTKFFLEIYANTGSPTDGAQNIVRYQDILVNI